MNWVAQMEARRCVLSLREILVRLDENLAANTLMQECVPYILESDPEIARARAEQQLKVNHITEGVGAYGDYYATNSHEQRFEDQYQIGALDAHLHLHRVAFLRDWISHQTGPRAFGDGPALTVLDVACNDGWMAANLHAAFPDLTYHGIDLNPSCVDRARTRKVPSSWFAVDRAENIGHPADVYDVVVAYELVEHVRDPDQLLAAMVSACKPGGSLFVSTPLGACTGGDLPEWWVLEPAGHVRAYTTSTFAQLLARHGHVDDIHISDDGAGGQLMVARVQVP